MTVSIEEILYRYNPWWEGKFTLDGVIDRTAITEAMYRQTKDRRISIITGLRRVGKTTLIKLLITRIIKSGLASPATILYVSVDDYLLSSKPIHEVIDEFRKIHKLPFREKCFVFLDEITYAPDFEIQLKNLHDNQNLKIYVSSSSASVLKSRKAYLTGRYTQMEILPLDFDEYLKFKNITIAKSDKHLTDRYFDEYLIAGGLPEYVLENQPDYVKNLVDDVIQKDIANIHNVRKISILKDFFILLMERAGKMASVNKLARILNLSPDTARRYFQMFLDSYLIYSIPRFGKTNTGILAPKKIYAADTGIRSHFTGVRDKGSLFENYVFLKIKDKKPRYIYENGVELDFFTEDRTLIEVKYGSQMNPKQQALFDQFNAKKKVVIRRVDDLKQIFR